MKEKLLPQMKHQLAKLSDEKKQLEKDLQETKGNLDESQQYLEEAQQYAVEKHKECAGLREERDDLTKQVKESQRFLDQAKHRADEMNKECEELKEERDDLTKQVKESQRCIDEAKHRADEMNKECEGLREERDALLKRVEESQKCFDEAKQCADEMNKECKGLREERDGLLKRVEELLIIAEYWRQTRGIQIQSLGEEPAGKEYEDKLVENNDNEGNRQFPPCWFPKEVAYVIFCKECNRLISGTGTSPYSIRGDSLVEFATILDKKVEGGLPTTAPDGGLKTYFDVLPAAMKHELVGRFPAISSVTTCISRIRTLCTSPKNAHGERIFKIQPGGRGWDVFKKHDETSYKHLANAVRQHYNQEHQNHPYPADCHYQCLPHLTAAYKRWRENNPIKAKAFDLSSFEQRYRSVPTIEQKGVRLKYYANSEYRQIQLWASAFDSYYDHFCQK